jgi:hypothetical protein
LAQKGFYQDENAYHDTGAGDDAEKPKSSSTEFLNECGHFLRTVV